MALALLSLGSNLDPEANLRSAARALREAFADAAFSPVLRYRAVGFEGPDFLNAAAAFATDLAPARLHDMFHALEDAHGRRRDVPRFSSRTLDIDLVFYGSLVCDGTEGPRLPRPELKHAFVLRPLADIAPDAVIAGQGRTVDEAWRAHPDFGTPAEVVDVEAGGF